MKKSLPLVSCAIILAAFMSGCHSSSKNNHGPVDQKIMSISGSNLNTVLLTDSGQIFGAGSSSSGALGLGVDNLDFTSFTHAPIYTYNSVAMMNSIKANYSAGATDTTSISVSNTGYLFGSGTNANGQLGFGALTDVLGSYTMIPVQLGTTDVALRTATGSENFSVVLAQNGTLFGTGKRVSGASTYNEYGDNTQLGGAAAPQLNTWTPITVKDGANVILFKDLASALYSGYYVDTTSQLWVAGDNRACQLGVANCAGNPIVGSIVKSAFAGQVAHVFAGVSAAALIDSNGALWVSGDNTTGHIGAGTTASITTFSKWTVQVGGQDVTFKEASISSTGIVALTTDGHVYVSGVNVPAGVTTYTVLGLPTATVSVDTPTLLAIQKDGKDVVFTHVHTTDNHTVLSDENGNLWVVGQNDHGQLGTGDKVDVEAYTMVPMLSL